MNRIIIIDNYDSFTYNLVQIVNEIEDTNITIRRNDETTLAEISAYTHILLSPGPGLPDEAGILKEVIQTLGPTHRILGICLGLQAIGEVYGATLKNLNEVFHGIQSTFQLTDIKSKIFNGIPSPFLAGRYHSWVIDRNTIPSELEITAIDEYNEVMATQHIEHHVYGVQFHPESIMTPMGIKMIENFLSI